MLHSFNEKQPSSNIVLPHPHVYKFKVKFKFVEKPFRKELWAKKKSISKYFLDF